MQITKQQINLFPNKPGIYIFKDSKGKILYIGKAKNLKKRVQQYFTPGSVRKQEMLNKSKTVEYLITESETEALQLEENLIKKNKPQFNSLLRNNNRYVYIKFTNEEFPQILIVKQRKNDGAIYIWPKYHNKELRNFLQYFRQLFQYRWCKKTQFNQWKLCSDYHFWLCKGRCTSSLSSQISPQNYKSVLNSIKSFFEWNTKKIEQEIQKQMDLSIQKHHFERSAKLRDMYYNIENLKEKQNVSIDPKINWYFIQIYEIKNRRVYVILHFFEWKLIDTITNKQSKFDTDHTSLITTFQAEFGKQKTNTKLITINEYTFSTNKISKKIYNKITPIFQNFLDSYIAQTSFQKENLLNDLLSQLQQKYQLKKFPYHIECIDISHFNWDRNSGGLSCLIGGVPEKKYYRRYKISAWISDKKSDDYASLKEVLLRRSKSENHPDLIILDGWLWQLNILKELSQSKNKSLQNLLKNTEIISLWKWAARTTKWKQSGHNEIIYKFQNLKLPSPLRRRTRGEVKHQKNTINKFPLTYDQADHLLIQLRNEAHNFANSYRKKQMSTQRK